MNEQKKRDEKPSACQEPRPGSGPTSGTAGAEELDLTVERIDTEGVMKEGFTGQEM